MNLKCKLILEEYKEKKSDFIQLGNTVTDIITALTKETDMKIFAIEHRVKTEKSLAGKLELKGDKYSSLGDITDILGVRIITYFDDEVDIIAKKIEQNFVIDWANSVDKRKAIDVNSFGYLSLHYICSLPFDSGYDENICGLKFEVQIRTTLQHTWAVIEHDIGYKTDFGVPRHAQRGFSQIAGILEIADEKFVELRDEIADYSKSVKEKIANGEGESILLDNISLNEYMNHNVKMLEFLDKLSCSCKNAEISFINASVYLEQLFYLNIKTIGDMQKLLDSASDLALKFAEYIFNTTELDIISSNTALRFLCRAYLITENYTPEQIEEFMLISFAQKDKAQKQARRLITVAEKIKGDGNSD